MTFDSITNTKLCQRKHTMHAIVAIPYKRSPAKTPKENPSPVNHENNPALYKLYPKHPSFRASASVNHKNPKRPVFPSLEITMYAAARLKKKVVEKIQTPMWWWTKGKRQKKKKKGRSRAVIIEWVCCMLEPVGGNNGPKSSAVVVFEREVDNSLGIFENILPGSLPPLKPTT
jgi:hypothetical protein